MTTQQAQVLPADFPGSLPEFIIVQTLTRLGLREGIDYTYQAPFFGGRQERGGLIIDFLFINPPDLAINVQGVFFHLESGVEVIARDRLARAQLAGEGITLIFIDEEDVLSDPLRFVRAALNYQDLSTLGG
jgi:hypothetical protein